MRFAAPENAWLLLLVPLAALFAAWAARARRRDLARFAHEAVAERLTRTVSRPRQHLKAGLVVAGILLAAIALTGPQFGVKLEMAQRRGVDVVFVLDMSRSMLAEDVRPSRLERARHAVGELLDALEGDRVGLVVYAADAFVQCPLTLDRGALRMLLHTVQTGDLPTQGTSLARALQAAGRSFEADDRQHKVVVVFSDGEAHTGDAAEAAEALAGEGVVVYCVGMGTPEGDLIPVRAGAGEAVEYHKDRSGNYVKSRLDESALRQVAAAGEGAYWRSSLAGRELEDLAGRISGMEEKELGAERFTHFEERYQIPLAAALLCFLAECLLTDRARGRREWRGRFA